MIVKKTNLYLVIATFVLAVIFLGRSTRTKKIKWDQLPNPSSEHCLFYPELEDRVQCSDLGKDEYLLSYGKKYCELFLQKRKDWLDPLKAWTIDTSQCLQESILENRSRIKTCYELKEYAFDLHPICYKSAGFCTKLKAADQLDVVFAVLDVSVLSEFRRSATQGFNVFLSCMDSGSIEVVALSDLLNNDLEAGVISLRDLTGIYNVNGLSRDDRLIYAKKALAVYLFNRDSDVAMSAVESFAKPYLGRKAPYFDERSTKDLSQDVKLKCYFDGGGPGCRVHAMRVDSPVTEMFKNYSSEKKEKKLEEILKIKKRLETKNWK